MAVSVTRQVIRRFPRAGQTRSRSGTAARGGRVATANDSFSLSVQVTGQEDRPVLLLLPGQANSHAWWNSLRCRFEDRFQVVSFDYRGTGDSRGPVGDWTTTLFADDAARVLRDLTTRPAAVYGTSMGGRVAQLLAARNPDLVDRLVLACTSPGGPHAKERSPALRRKVALGGNTALRELFYTDAWAGKNSLLLGDPSMSPEEKTAHLRASNRHNAWDFLPLIKARTLVMHGDNDLMVPTSNAAIMADRIPNAILYLHQGRHGFFDEFADEVQPLLDEFLVDRDAAL